ncbi:MAG: plasmid pRiA4b ORF-3 family protein [Candidatus Cybelea sp.]
MTSAKRGSAQVERPVFRLTVRLSGVMPIVWRTILLRPEVKLSTLHRYIQAAMGWHDCHLFSFTIDGKMYIVPSRAWDLDRKVYDARRYTLARLFPVIPARFTYLYDFGDHWEHVVEIEGVQPAEFRKQYPVCIAGAEPCPPEDCGGPEAYRELRVILRNPNDPEFAKYSEWVSSQHYRLRFDPRLATWEMREVRR